MLLKCSKSNLESSSNSPTTASTIIDRGTGMRMTMATASTMTPRIQRKNFRTPSKRHPGKAIPSKLHSISRMGPGKIPPGKRLPPRPHPPPCDNSNDSGFGFDQHVEVQQNSANNNSNHHHNHNNQQQLQQPQSLIRTIPSSRLTNATSDDRPREHLDTDDPGIDDDYHQNNSDAASEKSIDSNRNSNNVSKIKRRKTEIRAELDNDDACSEDEFIRKIATGTFGSQYVIKNNNNMIEAAPNLPQPQPPQPSTQQQSALSSSSSLSSSSLASSSRPPLTKLISNTNRTATRVAHKRQPSLASNNIATSSTGRVQLEIVSQPEQQHRARYQTEGSRGAVKDRSGNGFPIVRLVGYNKPATLKVFIGTDIGRVGAHMFYQACKVAGKNSTQCYEKKAPDGTMVIEIEFKPENDMTITCDCVGILKERNVDVEHRFPDHSGQKNKKKSTRCRMVFRTELSHDDGTFETLQVCSNPIICTQPPGVPEICKKSLYSCPVEGGLELFIIGKNFLKDTHVLFQETGGDNDGDTEVATHQQLGTMWKQSVLPDKEYLQQTHLICIVPAYLDQNILKPVTVQLSVVSSGKRSDWHPFVFTPKGTHTVLSAASTLSTLHGTLSSEQDSPFMDTMTTPASSGSVAVGGGIVDGRMLNCQTNSNQSGSNNSLWNAAVGLGCNSVEAKHEIDSDMMPPPSTTQIPMIMRRPWLTSAMITDQMVQISGLKTEMVDENSQNSFVDVIQPESMDQFPTVQQQQTAAGNSMMDDISNGPLKEPTTNYQYHHQRMRNHSLDMLDIRSMSILNDQSNTMASFPPSDTASNQMEAAVAAAAAAVEMAVNTEQQLALFNAATVQQQQQNQQSVGKFLSSLDSTLNNVKANDVTREQNTIFGVSRSPDVGAVFPTIQDAATNASIDQTITDILQHARATSNTSHVPLNEQIVRSLSISSNSSSSSASAPSSPNVAVKRINSPISHDVIHNAETTGINSMNMRQIIQRTGKCDQSSSDNISTDMLNPAISSAAMLCTSDGATSSLMVSHPHQVAIAESLLSGMSSALQSQQMQNPPTALTMNDIIMDTSTTNGQMTSNVQPQQQTPQDAEVTAASTVVSNMIIKAAADLISIQENNQNHQMNPESVLMSINTTATPGTQSQLLVDGGSNVVVPTVSLPQSIPQELTQMSDQDLISYINPSTFDQI